MSGYSGETSFDFPIERYRDKESGQLLVWDQNNQTNLDDDFEYQYEEHTLKVEGRSYFSPGKMYGPPENCYPDEGETEITAVIGPDGKDWEHLLTPSEKESILEQIATEVQEHIPEPDYDDYEPDYDD